MKTATTTSPFEAQQQRRQKWLRERSEAQALRRAFPSVEQLRIELTFADTSAFTPAAQTHTLNPPAQAFFRFFCPYPDCDGEFDLGQPIADLLRRSGLAVSGGLQCHGVRARDRATGLQCMLKLQYGIAAQYAAVEQGRRGR